MKRKLKLKKKFKIILILLILGTSTFIYLKKEYDEAKYKETYEYKFLEIGYSKEEIKKLCAEFNDVDLNKFLSIPYDENIILLIKEKYYISKNFNLYYDYLKENEHSLSDVVSIINVGVDNSFYENSVESNVIDKSLMLVNKYNYLNSEYTPENLVTISTNYSWGLEGSQKTNKECYEAFVKMAQDIKTNENIKLMINSSYRTYDSQKKVYDSFKNEFGEYYADTVAARAGYSEHQTGYALDIFSTNSPSKKNFVNSSAYDWLKNNSYKYGFILRYPEDKEYLTGYSFESWHYRYVGLEVAKYIYENNITFDEYYAYFVEN